MVDKLTVKANVMVCKDDRAVAFRCSSQSDMENTVGGLDVMLLETNKQKKRRRNEKKTSARGKEILSK